MSRGESFLSLSEWVFGLHIHSLPLLRVLSGGFGQPQSSVRAGYTLDSWHTHTHTHHFFGLAVVRFISVLSNH